MVCVPRLSLSLSLLHSNLTNGPLAKDFPKESPTNTTSSLIGSGLAGMTSANILGRGRSSAFLLLERHYNFGGIGRLVSTPGRPLHSRRYPCSGVSHTAMIKSCRSGIGTAEIADGFRAILTTSGVSTTLNVSLTTSFDAGRFSHGCLMTKFGIERSDVAAVFEPACARGHNVRSTNEPNRGRRWQVLGTPGVSSRTPRHLPRRRLVWCRLRVPGLSEPAVDDVGHSNAGRSRRPRGIRAYVFSDDSSCYPYPPKDSTRSPLWQSCLSDSERGGLHFYEGGT